MNEGCEFGGGGGVERAGGGRGAEVGGGGGAAGGVGALGGGRGAEVGGGGGATGGEDTVDIGRGGAVVDGFLDVIGGGGRFAVVGGGGGARGGRSELNLGAGLGGGFRICAASGLAAEADCGGDDSVVCGVGLKAFSLGAVGGFGTEEVGGFGADFLEVSGSERYEDSRSAPVSTPPPVFLSFGIPTPAKIPPNCGAEGTPPVSFPAPPPAISLLLLARFEAPAPGIGGARPAGGFPEFGIAGAPPIGGPAELPDGFSTAGADRSFVTAFLSFAPFVMSVRRAP